MSDPDLGNALPPPPPPAPARREAAIDAAMRRFDGRPAEPPARPAREAPFWRRQPQMGAFVTLGLMAVIGGPLAWLAVERTTAPSHEARTIARVEAPAPDVRAPEQEVAVRTAPRLNSPPATIPTAPARETVGGVVAPPAESAPATRLAEAGPGGAVTDNARKADQIASARVEGFGAPIAAAPAAVAPMLPPPPPPPAMAGVVAPAPAIASAQDEASSQNIVVTGMRARRQVKGADWSACTIDDPRRDVSRCADILRTARPGPAGVAASHVAEGLRRAWQDDLDGAAKEFDIAIQVAPKSSAAYLNRSLLSMRQNAGDRALADANKAVRYAPNSAQAYRVRATVLRQLGKDGKADDDERQAAELDER